MATLACDPGLRIARERRDVLGQRARRDVGERDLLGDRAQARADGDPHLLQRLGRPRVGDVLRPLAADRRERPLDRADDVGDRDLRGGPVEPVAALGAALAAHEAGVAQVAQDVLEELQRDPLRLRDGVALRRPVAVGRGELDRGADRVVDLGGDAHRRALSRTPARHHVVVPGMSTSIETARLAGRPPRADDVPALLALYGSVVVAARMYPDGRPRTEAQIGPYLEADLAHWRAHGFGRYMWHERDTGEVVARCGPKLDLRGGGGGRADVLRRARDRERHRRRPCRQRRLAGARRGARLRLRARRRALRPAAPALPPAPPGLSRYPAAFGLPVDRPGSSSGPPSGDVSGASVPPAPLSGPCRSPVPAPWPSGFSSGIWSAIPVWRGSSVGVASSRACWSLMRSGLPNRLRFSAPRGGGTRARRSRAARWSSGTGGS